MTTNDPFHIRPVQADDAPTLARLHVRSWQWAYRGLIPDTYLDNMTDTVPRREAWWCEMLSGRMAGSRAWVAVRAGEIAGFATTCPSRDDDAESTTGELSAIYLGETAARQGIGRALHEHAIADLKGRGYAPITLWVLESNARARRFYEAMGWRPDGATKVESHGDIDLHEVRYRLE